MQSTLQSSLVFGASSTPSLSYNPLSFDSQEEDPWSSAPSPSHSTPAISSAPSPAPIPPPAASSGFGFYAGADASSSFPPPTSAPSSSASTDPFIDEALLPQVYFAALDAIDAKAGGDVSVPALARLLRTGRGLGASEMERIINVVSEGRARVARREGLLALVLVGLAQEGVGEHSVALLVESYSDRGKADSFDPKDPTLDEAALRRSTPPTPDLDLSHLLFTPTASHLSSSNASSTPSLRSDHLPPTFPPPQSPPPTPSRPPVAIRQTSNDPWASAPAPKSNTLNGFDAMGGAVRESYPASVGGLSIAQQGIRGGLLAVDEWWTKLVGVELRLVPEVQGSWLKKVRSLSLASS